jgi:hypothetical protein
MRSTLLFLLLITLAAPEVTRAQVDSMLSVTPVVIDEKAKPRDILKKVILIKNISDRKLDLYPSVNNVNPDKGTEGFTTASNSDSLSNSLANWIELSRGVIEIEPGEQKAVSFIVRINFNAIPDSYHALITLTEGETRAEADKRPPLATITVNVEVQDDIKELLQLKGFKTETFFLSGDDVLFNYELQNIGNQNLEPRGEIHIYDRKGSEVATLEVNRERKSVSPDQASQLASIWTAVDGFGRYKALLTVDYGSAQAASVGDTVFFWIIPWKQLIALTIISLLLIVATALYVHRWFEQRHFTKLATAGLINTDLLHPPKAPSHMVPTNPQPLSTKAAKESVETPVHPPHKPSLKETLHKSGAHHAHSAPHGHSIDLKTLRGAARSETPRPTAGAVINLKKKV